MCTLPTPYWGTPAIAQTMTRDARILHAESLGASATSSNDEHRHNCPQGLGRKLIGWPKQRQVVLLRKSTLHTKLACADEARCASLAHARACAAFAVANTIASAPFYLTRTHERLNSEDFWARFATTHTPDQSLRLDLVKSP